VIPVNPGNPNGGGDVDQNYGQFQPGNPGNPGNLGNPGNSGNSGNPAPPGDSLGFPSDINAPWDN